MKHRGFFTVGVLGVLFCLGAGGANANGYSGGRIAIDADGNYNDPDDWASTPLELALLAASGLQSRLVHYGWANIISENKTDLYRQMSISTLGSAKRFNFSRSEFLDCQTSLDAAIGNLESEINKSTETDPLYIAAVGPMEVLWRAINASDPAARQHVTVVSHTNWNASKTFPPEMTHTREDVEALGVNWIQIKDQNQRLYPRNRSGASDWNAWHWLRDSDDPNLRWIYSRMRATGKADASDAGVVYYLLTNDQNATPRKIENLLRDLPAPS